MIFANIGRGDKVAEPLRGRIPRLIDLGLIERGKGRTLLLSRRYYETVGQKGAYTRRKGLDRETNLALLLKHIEDNREIGSKLDELCQVIPSLPRTTIQSLLKTLKQGQGESGWSNECRAVVSRFEQSFDGGLTQYDAIKRRPSIDAKLS